MAKKEKTLEAAMEELNQILAKLETDQISLEDSFLLYQEGMKLLKYCNDSIDKVEKKLIVLEEGSEDGV
ncbi:MAG TPA: exodeoxyribonuclease VII small subunit [Candidatus Caccomorpha excrementavium]|nr:exodeoxyribonuclease VII small subunit [Candidatus Caccomorpha excrementavium]